MGEKAKFNDRRFTVNADVFYVKWHDIQQLIVLSCGYPYNTNVGDAKAYGPELEMAAKLTDSITADLSGAYTQSYISEAKDTPGLPVTNGTRVTNIPKYTGNLAVSYESTLAQDYKFTFRIAESYVGPVEDTAYYRRDPGVVWLDGLQDGCGQVGLDGIVVRHEFDQQTRWTDHRQYGLRLAATDHHARFDQSAAHYWPGVRNEVLKAAAENCATRNSA